MQSDGARIPRVSLCLAMSLDGRISDKPGAPPNFTSRHDRNKLFRLRAEADALLIGANTVRQEQLPALVREQGLREARIAAGKPAHPAAVIVSASLELPWDSAYFREKQQEIFILTASPPDPARQKMEALGLHCLDSGERLSLRRGLQQLRRHGIETLLAEGGGRLTHGLLDENLVDRFYLTIAPVIFAGEDTPLLCHGPRLTPPTRFEMVGVERMDDEWHMEYRVRKSGGENAMPDSP